MYIYFLVDFFFGQYVRVEKFEPQTFWLLGRTLSRLSYVYVGISLLIVGLIFCFLFVMYSILRKFLLNGQLVLSFISFIFVNEINTL